MHPIEIQTSFGLVAAGEQALVEAIRELLASEGRETDDAAENASP